MYSEMKFPWQSMIMVCDLSTSARWSMFLEVYESLQKDQSPVINNSKINKSLSYRSSDLRGWRNLECQSFILLFYSSKNTVKWQHWPYTVQSSNEGICLNKHNWCMTPALVFSSELLQQHDLWLTIDFIHWLLCQVLPYKIKMRERETSPFRYF